MTKSKIFLWIQTALCALIAVLLAVAAVRIFLDGSAYQAAGHPSEWIYTREKVTAALMPILPLFLLSFAMTVHQGRGGGQACSGRRTGAGPGLRARRPAF